MGSSSELGCCAQAIRIALILINFFFGILGVIVLAIGIWAIVADSNFSFITGSGIISGAALLIICGIVTIIICVVGILGAIFKARPLLVVYALVVLVIVILEIVAGIVAFVFRDTLVDQIDRTVIEAIRGYTVSPDQEGYDPDRNLAIENIQMTLSCCGLNNASDWINENPEAVAAAGGLPGCPNCTLNEDDGCGTVNDPNNGRIYTTFIEGCGDISSTTITIFASVVGAIGIVFGILEIVGVLFALFLCCCITSARKQEVV